MKAKFLLVALMSVLTTATFASPDKKDKERVRIEITDKASPEDAARARELQTRVDEINAMDFNELSREERTSLKKELKDIQRETKQMDGVYFYFGGGALILLIILLIILL